MLAQNAKRHQIGQFLIISAMGADKSSRVFYSRTKGEMESDLRQLHLESLTIFRPSLLLGHRQEFRLGEEVAAMVSKVMPFLFKGPFKTYKPLNAKVVAEAMYRSALKEKEGIMIIPPDVIEELAKKS